METFHCAVQAGGETWGKICGWPDSMKENLALWISRVFLEEQLVFLYLLLFYHNGFHRFP